MTEKEKETSQIESDLMSKLDSNGKISQEDFISILKMMPTLTGKSVLKNNPFAYDFNPPPPRGISKSHFNQKDWQLISDDLSFDTYSMTCPAWPKQLPSPSLAHLINLDGYNTTDHGTQNNAAYYDTLIARKWTGASESQRHGIVRAHNSLVKQYEKMESQPAEWLKEVSEMKLPESFKSPVVYTTEDYPFTTLEEIDEYVFQQMAWDLHIRKMKFHLVGPCSIMYHGENVKFVGMETYRLQWVETVKESEESSTMKILFYFIAVDAMKVEKLYALSPSTTSKLFGQDPFRAVTDTLDTISRRSDIVEIKAHLENKILKDRYKDTGMEFGAW